MPIGKLDSDDGRHFRAIYHRVKSVMESAGYETIRADDVQKSGLITKDIVKRLGESDIVVADVTDLNPNVFYEMGVRHSLRGRGTLLIQDEKRTPHAPFDVSAYRAIRFVGDLTGIDVLSNALTEFVQEFEADGSKDRDNPVHDCFPALPMNLVDSSSRSSEAPLRQEIKVLQERVAEYERLYGKISSGSVSSAAPISFVLSMLSDAQEGLLPSAVMEDLGTIAGKQEIVPFLQKVRVVIEKSIRLKPAMFLQVCAWAAALDLESVVPALLQQARSLYPNDPNIQRAYIGQLVHSDLPADREKARTEIKKLLSVDIDAASLDQVSSYKFADDMELYGLLLDAYHRDSLHAEALAIAKKFLDVFPNSSKVLRNYARALDRIGDEELALEMFRKSIFAPDVDDTSATWFAAELHNRRRHREAAEVFALACYLDPSDPASFANLAEELSLTFEGRLGEFEALGLGAGLSDALIAMFYCARSCQIRNVDSVDTFRRVFGRMEIALELDEDIVYDRTQRIALAKRLYDGLKTDLTVPATAPLPEPPISPTDASTGAFVAQA